MNLSTLQNFITAAEMLNFSKAAEVEYISQPALSRRIAGLERELGVRLFERSGRGVELTDAGRVLLKQARELLERADWLVGAVRGLTPPTRVDVSVGLTGGVGVAAITELLCGLRAELPDVEIDVRNGEWASHLENLHAGTLDVVFGCLPSHIGSSCNSCSLWDFGVDVLVEESHPAARLERVGIAAFVDDQTMIPTRDIGRDYPSRFVERCVDAGFEPSIDDLSGRFDTVAAVQVAVATGRGIGLIPRDLAGDLPRNTRLITLSPVLPPSAVGVAWLRQNQSPVVASLIALARAGVSEPETLRWRQKRAVTSTIVAA